MRKIPKETFLKLPEEKKNKIILAAKKEFARVSLEQVSIKNIVEEAEIARGSFYQYFEDKEDLLGFILSNHLEEMNKKMIENIEEANGDIFEFFILIYDSMVDNCSQNKDMEFYKKIFENIKTSEDYLFSNNIIRGKPIKIKDLIEKINTSNLRAETKEDVEIIEKILFAVTNKAIVMRFKYESKEKAREDYLKQIEFLKYGILKDNVHLGTGPKRTKMS